MSVEEQAIVINEVASSYLALIATDSSDKARSQIDNFQDYLRELRVRILALQDKILVLESGSPKLSDRSDRQRDYAQIRSVESDLRSLEETEKTVALEIERLRLELRGGDRISLISQASTHPR